MVLWGKTDRGKVRQENQDAFLIDVLYSEKVAIFAVCDGMGGAKAGNVASDLAVKTFVSEIKNSIKPAMAKNYKRNIIQTAIRESNRIVYEKSLSDHQYAGMGTTIVCGIASGNSVVIANVGDSRAYTIDDEHGIHCITRDHSLVAEMLARGDITEEEAVNHPSKSLITRALGVDENVSADLYEVPITAGLRILLCSDGLTNMVTDQEILYEMLYTDQSENVCDRLVTLANQRGGCDNVTAVILKV